MLHLVVGEIKMIGVEVLVIAFDGEVTSLEDHGQRHLLVSFVIYEHLFRITLTRIFHHAFLTIAQQTHQISWRSGSEPIALHVKMCEGVEDAERIIYVHHSLAEVVAVIVSL